MRPPGAASGLFWEVLARAAPRATTKAAKAAGIQTFHAAPSSLFSSSVTASVPRSALSESLYSFVDSIAGGVFRSIQRRTPVFPVPTTASRIGRAPFRQPLQRTSRAAPARAFGPTPRPVVASPRTSSLGLGLARNFSSSRPVFENIVNNVPLGLRALFDGGDGLDQRKWRRTLRDLRRDQCTAVKGKGRFDPQARLASTKAEDFASYFSSAPVAASTAAPADSQVELSTANEPIILVIPLEPELGHLLATSDFATSLLHSYRLLTPDVLRALASVTTAYESQANRIRALANSLSRAGVDEDPDVRMEARFGGDGVKEVHVLFGGKWTMADVKQATGDWSDVGQAWYQIIDPSSYSPSLPSFDGRLDEFLSTNSFSSRCRNTREALSSGSSSPELAERSSPSLDFDSDLHDHDLVASSFHLPSLLETFESPETSHWDSDSDDGLSNFVHDDFDVDVELGPVPEWDSVLTESQIHYFEGVREHLGDLDSFERERDFLRASPPV